MKHTSSIKLSENWTAFHKEFSAHREFHNSDSRETFSFSLPMDTRHLMFLNGKCPNPRLGDNSKQSDWVSAREWWFNTEFTKPDLNPNQRVFLKFKGVDQLAEFFLNGTHFASSESFNQLHYFDITALLSSQPSQKLSIRLWACDVNDFQSQKEAMKNQLGSDSANMNMGKAGLAKATPQSLKSRMLYGGDQNPYMLATGLAIAPELILADSTLIKFARSEYAVSKEVSSITGDFIFDTVSWGDANYKATLTPKNFEGESFSFSGQWLAGDGPHKVSLAQVPVKFWYPLHIGIPHCYILTIECGGNVFSVVTGFRKFERLHNEFFKQGPVPSALDWHPYENQSYGQEYFKGVDAIREAGETWPDRPREGGHYNFTHFVNGKEVFAMGGSVVPTTLFWSDWKGSYLRSFMQRAAESHNNTLRVWGGGYLSGDEFFEEADLQGIMISQDFLNFAAMDKSLIMQLRLEKELKNVLQQISIHPSVVCMNGGNELLQHGVSNRYNDPVFHQMNRIMKELGSNQYFHWSSPVNPEVHGPWHVDLDHFARYNSCKTIFNSECGVCAAPSLKGLRKQLNEDQINDLFGSTWKHRMPDPGYFAVTETYSDLFNPREKATIDSTIKSTQWVQAMGYQYLVEEFRRQKPIMSGFTTWEFNEPWIDFNWGTLDSFLIPKHSFFTFRRACAKHLISARFESFVFAEGSTFKADIYFSKEGDEVSSFNGSAEIIDESGKIVASKSFSGKSHGYSVHLGTVEAIVQKGSLFYLRLHGKAGAEDLRNEYVFFVLPRADTPPLKVLFVSGDCYESKVIHEFYRSCNFDLKTVEVDPLHQCKSGLHSLASYDVVVLGPVFNPITSLGGNVFFKELREAIEQGTGFVYFGYNTSAYVSGKYEVDDLRGSELEKLLPFNFSPNYYSNSDEHNGQWSIGSKNEDAPWNIKGGGFQKLKEHAIWTGINMENAPILGIRIATQPGLEGDILGVEGPQPVLAERRIGKGRVVAFAGPYGGQQFPETLFRRWKYSHTLLANIVEYSGRGTVSERHWSHHPFGPLMHQAKTTLEAKIEKGQVDGLSKFWSINVTNTGKVPALYVTISNDSSEEGETFDFKCSDNFLVLFPSETRIIRAEAKSRESCTIPADIEISLSAWNI